MENNKALTTEEFEEFARSNKEALTSIEESLKTSETRVLTAIENLATKLSDVIDKDYPFQKKRISRVEFHTRKLLGKKLDKTNAEFEEDYKGEQARAEQEAKAH